MTYTPYVIAIITAYLLGSIPFGLLLAKAHGDLKKFDEAVKNYQRALESRPQDPDVLRGLGEAHLAAGRAPEAESALRAAARIRADPDTATTLGFALVKQKKAKDALSLFERVLQAGDQPLALFGAATASEQLGETKQAVGFYERLLAIKPKTAKDAEDPTFNRLRYDAQERKEALMAPPR